jgi:chemotaxis family two-component system response regulator Rcp1
MGTNMQVQELDLPSANGLWTGMMAGSGSNPKQDEDPSSDSRYQTDDSGPDVPSILIVEDSEADIFLVQEAIHSANFPITVHLVKDGEQAVRFFDRTDEDAALTCPALVILDINLPKKQGGEVLKHMRKSRRCGPIPVIVVSSSESAYDRAEMRRLGAYLYFHKPSAYEQFMKLGDIIKMLLDTRSP